MKKRISIILTISLLITMMTACSDEKAKIDIDIPSGVLADTFVNDDMVNLLDQAGKKVDSSIKTNDDGSKTWSLEEGAHKKLVDILYEKMDRIIEEIIELEPDIDNIEYTDDFTNIVFKVHQDNRDDYLKDVATEFGIVASSFQLMIPHNIDMNIVIEDVKTGEKLDDVNITKIVDELNNANDKYKDIIDDVDVDKK